MGSTEMPTSKKDVLAMAKGIYDECEDTLARIESLEADMTAILDAYIAQLGFGQYRVILPGGRIEIAKTRSKARRMILAAAKKDK